MTNAVPIRIADAVTAEINGNAFDIGEFTAVRSTGSWDKEFSGLKKMAVDVLYRKNGVSMALMDRNTLQYDVMVVVVVRKRFEPHDRGGDEGQIKASVVDVLDTLVIDIAKLFISRRNEIILEDAADASYDPQDIKPMLGNEAKLREGLYYGLVQIPFTYPESI